MESTLKQLRRLLGNLLRIQPGEGVKTARMFGVLFCVVGFFITGRVARDSLFLSRYQVSYLPMMYVWVALGVSLQSYLYSKIADRFRRDRIIITTLLLVLLLVLAARLLLSFCGDWLYPVLYVFVELAGTLLVIQAWTLANDIFTTREAKRLFSLVGAGGVISAVVLGFGVRGIVRLTGTENLLLLAAGLLVPAMALIWRLSHDCRPELLANMTVPSQQRGATAIRLKSDWSRFWANRQLLTIASVVLLLGFTITLVDYQFKVAARASYIGQEQRLAGFFGTFWAITGAINCLIQFFVTSRLLERQGILLALLLLPGSLLLGGAAVLLVPALWSVTLLKGSEAVLRYTINDASMQLLYLPVPGYFRGRAKAFIDGIVRQLSVGLTGALLVWLVPGFPAPLITWLVVVLCALWLGAAALAHRQYYRSLFSSLRSRSFQLREAHQAIPDESANRLLQQALRQPDERTVLHALELAASRSGIDWSQEMSQLLRHQSPAVRSAAVEMLGSRGSLKDGRLVFELLRDRHPGVRAAAVEAYCSLGKDRAIPVISRFLDDRDAVVQSAAVVGLIRYGGLDGVLSAAERLKAMLTSSKPQERRLGATVLGEIGVKNFYHPLLQLLVDDETEVRLAAIKAAGRMRCPELLPALVYRLAERPTRIAAAEALAQHGDQAVPLLAKVLANRDESLAVRLAVPSILARIGSQAAMDTLMKHLDENDDTLRNRILEALHRLLLRVPYLRYSRERAKASLLTEIKQLYLLVFRYRALAPLSSPALDEALRHEREKATRRTFRLLGLLRPVRTVDVIYNHINHPSRRLQANAVELLDGLLDRQLKRLLLPLFDPSLADQLQENWRSLGTRLPANSAANLREVLSANNPWLVACALWTIGQRKLLELAGDVHEATLSEHALVRQTALLVLSRLDRGRQLAKILNRHLRDPDVAVRDMSGWLLQQLDAGRLVPHGPGG